MAELIRAYSGEGYLQVMACDNRPEDGAFIVIYSYRKLQDLNKRLTKLAYKTKKDVATVIIDILYGDEINSASCHINFPYMCYTYRIGAIGSTMDTDQTDRKVGIIYMETGEHFLYNAGDLKIEDISLFNGISVPRWKALAGIGILKTEKEKIL